MTEADINRRLWLAVLRGLMLICAEIKKVYTEAK